MGYAALRLGQFGCTVRFLGTASGFGLLELTVLFICSGLGLTAFAETAVEFLMEVLRIEIIDLVFYLGLLSLLFLLFLSLFQAAMALGKNFLTGTPCAIGIAGDGGLILLSLLIILVFIIIVISIVLIFLAATSGISLGGTAVGFLVLLEFLGLLVFAVDGDGNEYE